MGKVAISEEYLTDIANSIREKLESQDTYKVSEMSEAIDSIESGSGSKYTGHIDSDGLAQIGYTSEDIQYYQKNLVDWNEEDDNNYKLTADELLGDETKNTRYLPKNANVSNFSNYLRLLFVPKLDETANMICNFNGCVSLRLIEPSNFSTSNTTSLASAFYDCMNLKKLDLSNLNTSNVTSMSTMFYRCFKLEEINLSNFDTTDVTNMSSMFGNCNNLKEIDLSSFNTTKVTNVGGMFTNCFELEEIDINNFDTSNVTIAYSMFSNCVNLKRVNLGNFYTTKMTNISGIFNNCFKLEEIDLSNMITKSGSSGPSYTTMFDGCVSLKKLDIRNADFRWVQSSKVTNLFRGVPNNCLIIVKNADEKNWYTTNWPNLTNVKTVAEYEAM